jgi:hypothetical protein
VFKGERWPLWNPQLRLASATCALTGITRSLSGALNVRGAMNRSGTTITGVAWDHGYGSAFTVVRISP